MTPNNEVKAPRPCTLPKEWVGTGIIDSYKAIIYTYPSSRNKYRVDVVSGHTRYSKEHSNVSDMMVSYREAIQAIASAQRPWLKAEGFQFVDGQWYNIMQYGNIVYPYKYDATENSFTNSDLSAKDWNDPYLIKRRDVLAFKPISDTQEAWNAVAGVEVWEVV